MSPIVAVVQPDQLSIDQYYVFQLDASPSYDQENSTNKNFTYIWDCPTTTNITSKSCNTNGSKLSINYNDRIVMGLN